MRSITVLAVAALAAPAAPAAPAADRPGVTLSKADIQADDGSDALRVRALDARTGKPLAKFRVISGVDIKIRIEPEFARRHPGQEVVNWQPHTTRIGSDGVWTRSMRRLYNPLALRVEAEGYVSTRYLWIDKKRGSQEIEFRLAADPGIGGRVLTPDGEPAAGAKIGIALVQRNLSLRPGPTFRGFGEPEADKPGDRWRRPFMVEADARGEFTLPTENDPACAVVAVHASGIGEMFYADFLMSRNLQLKKWGRVEGIVTLGDEPGAGEKVSLGTQRHGYGYPGMFRQYVERKADAEGRFVFEGLAPGLAQVSLPDRFPKLDDRFGGGFGGPPIPAGAYAHVTVPAGGKVAVQLGGVGIRPLGKGDPQIDERRLLDQLQRE